MRIIEIIFGVLFSPFIWVDQRIIKGIPSSPPEFWLYIRELRDRGINGQLQMQKLDIEGVIKSAIVVLDPNPPSYKGVNLFKCNSVETAKKQLTELERNNNPFMSHGKQRDCYLISVTFMEPNEELAAKITEAFGVFELPPNKANSSDAKKRRG